jgi:hydrogenase maturation protein HypF
VIKIKLPVSLKRPVLALGSQVKNTVCFAKNKTAYISAAHKDLSDPGDLAAFEKDVKFFIRNKPRVLACDLHPEYVSTKYAHEVSESQGIKVSGVQHHHAHIAGCMAENGLRNRKVIGVAFDGTGLGSDGSLWGGEFLVCDYRNFIRAGHLKEVALIGGEKAILQPWRLLAALGLDRPAQANKKQWDLVKRMQAKKFNSPMASSMGRLFDAAAVLVLGKCQADFEAELAIEFGKLAFNFDPSSVKYDFKIIKDKENYVIDPVPVLRQMIKDLKAGEAKPEIAYRFHLAAAKMVAGVCVILRKKYKINQVVLSGGVFQNNLMLRLSLDLLYRQGFKIFIHKKLSCNDSGLSLGQAVIAGLRS